MDLSQLQILVPPSVRARLHLLQSDCIPQYSTARRVLHTACCTGFGHQFCLGLLQAFGAKAYHEVGHIWQRAALILWVTCLPITVLWLFSEQLLLASGQEPPVAELGALFLK